MADLRTQRTTAKKACWSWAPTRALGNISPIEFAFTHEAGKHSDAVSRLSSNFDLVEQPTMLGAWPAVSLLFHRHDVAEAKQDAVLRLTKPACSTRYSAPVRPRSWCASARRVSALARGRRWRSCSSFWPPRSKTASPARNGGELVHDALQGRLLVNTPRTQAFAGFPPQKLRLANVELELRNAFAVVIVSALDDQPLATAKRILVTALGNAVNSGMTLGPGRNRLENAGVSPVLVEPIVGRLQLDGLTASGHPRVHALGPNGEHDHAVEVVETAAGLSFGLSAEHRTMHYEIVRE